MRTRRLERERLIWAPLKQVFEFFSNASVHVR